MTRKYSSAVILTFLLITLSKTSFSQVLNDFGTQQLLRNSPSFDYLDLAEIKEPKIINPNDFEGVLNRAIKNIEEEKFNSAKKDLNYLIEQNPKYGGSYYYRALCYKLQFKIDSAVADFNKALSLKPFQYYGPSNLELGYIQLNYYEDRVKAGDFFELALKFIPDNKEANYAAAYLSFQNEKFEEVAKHAAQLIAIDSTFKDAYYLIIESYLNTKNSVKAQLYTDKLLSIFPSDENAIVLRAIINASKKSEKNGIEQLDEIISAYPNNPRAASILAQFYFEKYEMDLCFEYLMKVIRCNVLSEAQYGISPKLDYYIKLQRVWFQIEREKQQYSAELLGNFNDVLMYLLWNQRHKARKILIGLNEKFENLPIGLLMLRSAMYEAISGRGYWKEDNLKILETDSTIHHVHRSLAMYYFHNEDYVNSERHWSKCLTLNREVAQSYKKRGVCRFETKKYIEAIQDLNIYLEYNSIDEEAIMIRAASYQNLGYNEKAIKGYRTVNGLNPKNTMSVVYLNILNIYMAQGDTTNSIATLDELIQKINELGLRKDSGIAIDQVYSMRGDLHFGLDNYKEAAFDFSEAIKFEETNDENYIKRGYCFMLLDKKSAAIGDFSKWLTTNANDPVILYHVGRLHYELGDALKSEKFLLRAERLGVFEAGLLLAEVIKRKKKLKKKE